MHRNDDPIQEEHFSSTSSILCWPFSEQGFIFFKKSQASSSSFSSSLRISRFIIFLSLRSILLKRDFDVCYEYRFGLLRVTTTEARDSRGIQADNTKGQGKMLDEKSSHTKSKLPH